MRSLLCFALVAGTICFSAAQGDIADADAATFAVNLVHGRSLQTVVSTVSELTAAVEAAHTGSANHILLAAGNYALTAQIRINHHKLTLEAQTPGTVTLDGGGARRIFYVEDGHVELKGLIITRGHAPSTSDYGYGGGLLIFGGNVTMNDCTVHGNTAESGAGIFIDSSTATVYLNRCAIYENVATQRGGGLFVFQTFMSPDFHVVYPSPVNTVHAASSDIYHNTAEYGGGVYMAMDSMNGQICDPGCDTTTSQSCEKYNGTVGSSTPVVPSLLMTIATSTFDDCHFYGNTAAGSTIGNDVRVRLDVCPFIDNSVQILPPDGAVCDFQTSGSASAFGSDSTSASGLCPLVASAAPTSAPTFIGQTHAPSSSPVATPLFDAPTTSPSSSPTEVEVACQEIPLHDGWTWFSLNVEWPGAPNDPNGLMGMNTIFQHTTLSSGTLVKSQSAFTKYFPGYGFFSSTMKTLSTDMAFKIKLTGGVGSSIRFCAPPVVLPKQIHIKDGWTWIPSLGQTSTPISQAFNTEQFGGFVFNDICKSQSQYSRFYPNYGWFGPLSHLEPGKGYKIRACESGPCKQTGGGWATFGTASATSGRRQMMATDDTSPVTSTHAQTQMLVGRVSVNDPTSWKVQKTSYADTASLTVLVTIDGINVDKGLLRATVGDTVHGVAKGEIYPEHPAFGISAGRYVFELSVGSDSPADSLDETLISFEYSPDGVTSVPLAPTYSFVTNDVETLELTGSHAALPRAPAVAKKTTWMPASVSKLLNIFKPRASV